VIAHGVQQPDQKATHVGVQPERKFTTPTERTQSPGVLEDGHLDHIACLPNGELIAAPRQRGDAMATSAVSMVDEAHP
jgi:hypothetical protein